ncbi:MAG TPA: hypothetical protein DEG17_25430 [Cyanobacteria bacterium UBA11149]|nr:hypothetical protein [Cyanobacteria bacterium UBA11149]
MSLVVGNFGSLIFFPLLKPQLWSISGAGVGSYGFFLWMRLGDIDTWDWELGNFLNIRRDGVILPQNLTKLHQFPSSPHELVEESGFDNSAPNLYPG